MQSLQSEKVQVKSVSAGGSHLSKAVGCTSKLGVCHGAKQSYLQQFLEAALDQAICKAIDAVVFEEALLV